jgi:transcriptional regulator with XRE-family HTH domain
LDRDDSLNGFLEVSRWSTGTGVRVLRLSSIAALVRQRRRQLGWSQVRLAKETGTSRTWVIELQIAKATVELGLALRALKALGLELRIEASPTLRLDPKGGTR